jgi:membrane protease YdiL (CAAX protease family)
VILAVVGVELALPRLRPARERASGQDTARRVLAEMQVRQIVGMAELFGHGQRHALYVEARKTLDTGPVADRLRFVVVAGDLEGPGEALDQLRQLREQTARQGVEVTPEQQDLIAALDRLYSDRVVHEALIAAAAVSGAAPAGGQPWKALASLATAAQWAPPLTTEARVAAAAASGLGPPVGQPWNALASLAAAAAGRTPPSLTAADRELLVRDLGWCGELALAPAGEADTAARAAVIRPARRLAVTFAALAGAAFGVGLLGLVGLIVWFALFLAGRLRPALPLPTRHGGIYAEAFAVYMVVFLGLSLARGLLRWDGPELLLGGLGMLLSLAAGLAWPVLRGIPWREVRQEVGLTLGRHPLRESVVGLVGYALILPVFGIGVLVTYVLLGIQRRQQLGDRPEEQFSPVETPSHPIVEWLQHPNWWLLFQVVVLACVLAPLVEETMFRGVLYRHLRNATDRLGRAGSFLVSAVVVSFVFAVIHPQGFLAVPALMALAFGLTILREWRGSLLPSMMVHGIHNGLTTFLLVQALSG